MLPGVLTLLDKRQAPIYPRWFGYFRNWCAIGLSPAGLIIFIKDGPLAWNGLLAFWIAASTAVVWIVVTSIATASAIKSQPAPSVSVSEGDLAARVARWRIS